jgi:UDP-N-acetylglucosamine 2-epimerase (non-hydrolysing)/GDP/UDP-N,N'-diacetylbacillosamine 2-epimerase (hydrolysing)
VCRAEQFAATHADSRLLTNLDHLTYLSLLSHVGALVGNSSSGIIESTSLEVPVVNIGIRQQGRERAANVIDVKADRTIIRRAISQTLSEDFRRGIRGLKSPYGDGKASQIICKTLLKAPLGPKLLFKRAAAA